MTVRRIAFAGLALAGILASSYLWLPRLAVGAQGLTVGGYSLVSERRVSRTHFEYTYRATLTNPGPAIGGASAQGTSRSARTVFVDAHLTFGPVGAASSAVSQDTFTIRHDRSVPFNPGDLVWTVNPVAANRPPSAVIAPVGAAFVAQSVPLDGTGSSDPDGDPLTYQWTFAERPSNSGATILNATASQASFIPDRKGTYRLRLEVRDALLSAAAELAIVTANSPPVSDAGPSQTVPVNTVVTLDGSGSTDVDGDSLTYHWAFVSVPSSSQAALSDATAVRPTFLVDRPGEYRLRLIVHDGTIASAADVVIVTTSNSAPVANAGVDRTVTRGELVSLDGSGSTDVDGDNLTYAWELTQRPLGSNAVLGEPTSVHPSFIADRRGDFVVRLTVSDGQLTHQDVVVISTENSQPVANAGTDQRVALHATVTLDGSGSTDVDGDPLTYQWSLTTVPAGSAAIIQNPAAVMPTFVADLPGDYVAQLVVNDGFVASSPDTVAISTDNTRPIAEAGPNQSVIAGNVVALDGSGSRDPDGDAISFLWSLTRPEGSTAQISDPTSATPTFVADVTGTFVAQLIVDDGRLTSEPDTATITTANSVPTANAGPDRADVLAGSRVDLDGSASQDADGHALAFQWSLLTVPQGSAAVLADATTPFPSFLADLDGEYVIQLIVRDPFGPSLPDTVTVLVVEGNAAPLANAGADQTVTVGSLVTLNGTGSSDADGDPLTYEWTLIGAPDGSSATLQNAASAMPSLVADVPGGYLVQLVVNDGTADSSPDTVAITAEELEGPPTITSFSPTSGRVGAVVTIHGTNLTNVQSVTFNAVAAATFTPGGSTALSAVVPDAATSGPIGVTTTVGSTASTGHFIVLQSEDFELTVTPGGVTIPAGGSGALQIQVNGTNFTKLVTLGLSGVPDGVTASFSAPALTAGQSTMLTLQATGMVSQPFALTVSGAATVNGSPVTRMANATVEVAGAGITTIAGQFITIHGAPIPNVLVQMGAVQTHSDAAGNFVLQNVTEGLQPLMIDANVAVAGYPIYKIDLQVVAGQLMNLPPFKITPPPTADKFTPFNNATQNQIITDSRYPGFELTLPAGARIIGWDGTPKTKIAIERILPDDLPVPPPPGVTRSLYQIHFGTPMGGIPNQRLPVTLPNDQGFDPGQQAEIWWYDAAPSSGPGAWKFAGMGTVSLDGSKIVSNPGVGIDRFCGVCGLVCIVNRGENQDPRNPDSPTAGDPVDLALGQMIVEKTDLVLPGRIPAVVHRTYNPTDPFGGIAGFQTGLGAGWALSVEVVMLEVNAFVRRLILAGNARFDFVRRPDGTFTSGHRRFNGAVLTSDGGGEHRLRFKDGSVWRFRRDVVIGIDLLVEEIDRNGNSLQIERTTNAINRIVEPSGRALAFTYSSGRISQITDPLGRTVRYTYDNANRLETVTDAGGGITRYTYNNAGGILTITDARGIEYIRNEYSPFSGRLWRQIQADGSEWHFRYRAQVRWLQGRGFPDVQEERPDRVNELANALTRKGFCNENGGCFPGWHGDLRTPPLSTTVVNPRGGTTTHSFVNGFTNEMTNALGQKTRFERNTNGDLTKVIDPLGRVTTFEYDALGNTTRVTDPQNNITQFEYHPTFGGVTRITDAAGNMTTLDYDARGNLTKITDPEQQELPEGERRSTLVAYNGVGQPTTITDPLGNATSLTYNEHGNLATIADPLGNTSRLAYDVVSRVVTHTDPRDATTTFVYDNLNQIASVVDALGRTTSFAYDANGNLLRLTDARLNSVEYEYDAMDRLLKRNDQLGRSETFEYDANGNLTKSIDRKGQTSTFDYDPVDKLVEARFADGAVSTYVYDAAGRLVRADDSVDPHRPITLAYNELDRLVEETTALGSVRYGYDAIGRRTHMVASGAEPVLYTYDRNSRLRSVTQGPIDPAAFEYDASDRRTRLTLPNGVSTEYQYDSASRVTALIYRNALGPLGELTYQYDRSGNRVGVGGTLARSLLPEPVNNAGYDAANQQLQFGDKQSSYDANGNLASIVDPAGTSIFAWDARNRLIGLSTPGTSGEFAYDAFGRRASKKINGQSTQFTYDGVDFISELIDGAPVSYLRSLFVDEALARSRTDHYVADALGSIVALTDSTGAVSTQYSYEPFGDTRRTGQPTDNVNQFTGRENDDTSLYFYRSRYYSPDRQRFISEDVIEFAGGMNLFGFVSNNPVNAKDPLGYAPYQLRIDANAKSCLSGRKSAADFVRCFERQTCDSGKSEAQNAYDAFRAAQYARGALGWHDVEALAYAEHYLFARHFSTASSSGGALMVLGIFGYETAKLAAITVDSTLNFATFGLWDWHLIKTRVFKTGAGLATTPSLEAIGWGLGGVVGDLRGNCRGALP